MSVETPAVWDDRRFIPGGAGALQPVRWPLSWRLRMAWQRLLDWVYHPLWLMRFSKCEREGHDWEKTGEGHNWEFGVTERLYECRRCGMSDSSV